jgi:glucose-6-phosphate isomerase
VKTSDRNLKIPREVANLDNLNYLAGKSMDYINQKAAEGTQKAHADGGVPVSEIIIDKMDEYHLGQLLYFFEKACGMSAYSLGVNPFDQPGVEAYKSNMFKLLGKK